MIDLNDDNASVYVDNPTMRGDFLPNRVAQLRINAALRAVYRFAILGHRQTGR
jgi:hypothetical protein